MAEGGVVGGVNGIQGAQECGGIGDMYKRQESMGGDCVRCAYKGREW